MPLVERVGDRIQLRTADGYVPRYEFDRLKRSAESVVGASFRKRDKVWTYPLDLVTCRDLRSAFGESLEIGPNLMSWAKVQVDKESRLLKLLTARDTDNLTVLPGRAPLIWEAMNYERCLVPGCTIGGRKHKPDHRIQSYKYQKPVVEYMVVAGRCQNASQPGLGKTIETLAAIVERETSGLVLVAAPKTSLRTVWQPEIERWLPGVPVFPCTGGRRRRLDTLTKAMMAWKNGKNSLVFVIINPEMLQTKKIEDCLDCDGSKEAHESDHKMATYYEHEYPQLFEQKWSAFVVDETHRYILNVNLRTKRVTQTGTGAMMIPLESDAMKIALSGTPWKGRPRNAWSIRHWCDGDVGLAASFWNWANRMLQVENQEIMIKGGRTKEVAAVGDVRDEEVFNRWCDSFMIRHTKAEMAPWLPPKTYAGTRLYPKDPSSPVGIWLEMDGPQEKAYRDWEANATVQLENGLLIGNGILAEFTRAKQFAVSYGDLIDIMVKGQPVKQFVPKLPSNKFDWLVEMLDERGIRGKDPEGKSKVVVASQHTKFINLVNEGLRQLGINRYVLTGETSDRNREAYVRQFQDNDWARVFLLNTTAGGVSVTLDAADDLVFMDETWVPDEQEQVEDRIHRTSKIHNVTIYYVRTRDTIDERIAMETEGKDTVQKRLLDGKRGVEYAKHLLAGE